jgi:hypothetical protein
MRNVLAGALAILFAATLGAQQPRSLDDPIDVFNLPDPLPECGIEEPLWRLAQAARVLIGVESTSDCFRNPIGAPVVSGSDDLRGVNARQVLDRLVALAPAYQWREMSGVAVVRPASAWSDPANPLNFRTDPFSLTDGRLMDGVDGVLRVSSSPYERTPRPEHGVDRPFSVSFGGGTILDAFNVLIRAHQSAFWNAGVIGTGSKRHLGVYMIGTPGHSHFATETPVARLTARQ